MGYNVKRSQSSRVLEISKTLGLPYNTVNRVISEYIYSLQESVLRGEDAGINGVFSIKMYYNDDGVMVAHGSISNALKQKLAEEHITREARLIKSGV